MSDTSPPKVSLYQFTLCPFCNKVQAALEMKGIAYDTVEVSPRSKVELPPLPEDSPKKVPVMVVHYPEGDEVIQDSTDILQHMETERFAALFEGFPPALVSEEEQDRAWEIEGWVDDEFIPALPTVIYGSKSDATKAARIIAETSKLSFGQRIGVNLVGSFIMRKVAQRLLEKHGKTDGQAWVAGTAKQFSEWLDNKPFVLGDKPSVADASMQGAIACVEPFPVFNKLMQDPRIAGWYGRVVEARHRGLA